ncbi:MAG TPA: MFS transporter [Anaerolineales bacterium]|nr:MFS transporter [Anaerolineales bacterium]
MKATHSAHPVRPIPATIGYYATFIVLGLMIGANGPVLPSLARHTASSLDRISIIFVASSFGYMIGTWLGGKAYGRFNGHRVMAAGLAIAGLGAFFVPIITQLWLLVGVMVVFGSVQGLVDLGGNTLLMWVHGEKVGPFMNGLHFFFGVGAFVAPMIIAPLIANLGDIQWVFWIMALLCIPLALWTWFQPAPKVRSQTDVQTGRIVSPLLVGMVVGFIFLYVGSEITYGNWIYTYAVKLNLATDVSAAYLSSAYWGFFTLSRLAGVWISTRLHAEKVLLMDMCSAIASIALILVWPNNPTVLWIGTILFGISLASIFPTTMTFAEQRLHLTAESSGWILVGSGAGGMFWPWLVGQLFVKAGPHITMPIVLVDVILNLGMLTLILTTLAKKSAGRLAVDRAAKA